MAQKDLRLNLVFGTFVALLAAMALTSMYVNRNRPVIMEPDPHMSGGGLPEGHPPIAGAGLAQALEQMAVKDPGNPDLQAQLGNAYYDSAEYQKAIGAYEQSLRLKPGDPNVETDLATCYLHVGKPDKALEILDRVLRNKPDFSQALFNKGIVLQRQNDVQGAIAAWQRLLETDPDFSQRAALESHIRELKAGKK